MKKALLIILFISTNLLSQNDCSDAITVCGNSGYNDLNATGIGKQELSSSNNCSSSENNSLWFRLNIKTGGTLGFILTPNSSDINEDFDFFIFGPNATCNNLGFAIRCSTTNPESAGQGNNLTGMNSTENDTSEGPGIDGNSFIKWLTVKDGDSYFLVIDRPIGNSNFKLEWTGTAKFSDPPVINPSVKATNTLDLKECDGNDDQKAIFDLTINNIIVNSQANVAITYHTSSNDATLGVNPISNPNTFTNTSNPQTIYARLTNSITGCFTTKNFLLTVNENAKATAPSNYIVCDDMVSGSDTDGIYNSFILNTKDAEILSSLKPSEYKVSYHTSQNGADTNSDIIDKNSNYKNTTASSQKIYIRLEKLSNTECFDTSKSFNLIINPLPQTTNFVELKQCDDNTDGITSFNLTEAERLIVNNSTKPTFTYFTTRNGALNADASLQINNITAYKNTQVSGESVWARVTNQNNCFRISEIKLVVSTTQIPSNFLLRYNQCDDPDAINNFDGITTFDISNSIQKIQALFPSNQSLEITLYETQENALAETNKITNLNSFRNTTANEQYLFVRVDNKTNNSCLGLGNYIRLVIDSPPSFTISSPQIICLNNPVLVLEAENPADIYTYQWIKDNSITSIGNTSTLKITNSGTYKVTAFNTTTNCSRTETIVVNKSITPSIQDSDIIVTDGDSNNSIQIKKDNLGIGDYEFSLQNEQGELVRNYQDNPLFNNLAGGIYTLFVRDKNGCGITQIKVPVIEFPRFFTPNNDGSNDVWKIRGVNTTFFPQSSISIFNRSGKLLTKLNLNDSGWNGTYNGKLLPSNDYWYDIRLTNRNGITRSKKGHFSLLRK